MAIQNRRGQAVDFVPSKMLPGEFAVSLDNRKLYMCFASGTVKEVALTDDVTQAISTASTSLGGRIAVLESASTEQGATLLILVTRMGTAEAAIRSHDGRLVVLENDGTNIKARLSDVESETATLDELLTDLNLNMITISNDVESLKTNAVRFDTVQNKSAAQKLQARENTDSAGIASLATAYSPSARYAVGDMVTYDGKLYTCKTAITTAEAWNSSHWTEVTVGDQLSDLKDDLNNIKPGLSDDAKLALMACLEQVAWKNPNANIYLQALEIALEIGKRIISGSDLGNYGMWYTAYPYYALNNARLAYTKLDIPVTGGKIYAIKANTSQSNVNMRIDIYNENILARAANEENISQSDHQFATGDWNALEQAIVMPKMINDSPTAGIICIVRYSDDSNINVGAVDSIVIQEKTIGTVPSDYTEYDYIAVKGSSSVTTDATAVIMTTVYNDLGHAYISLDYLATSNLGTSNIPIIGVRGENDWAHTVCIYITSGKDYTVHSHGNKVISDAVTKNKINHIDLRQGGASPSIVVANGAKTEIAWTQDNIVYAPMYLFANAVYNVTTSFSLSANVQLGQFVIWEADGEPDVYVPVVRNSDSVIGVYNVTRQEFHTCSDTTKAKVGHSNCLYQVGNW